jgi:hypothetical protein
MIAIGKFPNPSSARSLTMTIGKAHCHVRKAEKSFSFLFVEEISSLGFPVSVRSQHSREKGSRNRLIRVQKRKRVKTFFLPQELSVLSRKKREKKKKKRKIRVDSVSEFSSPSRRAVKVKKFSDDFALEKKKDKQFLLLVP